MKTLTVLDELKSLIPPLKPEELEQLHRELDAVGRATDPLTVWKKGDVLVDGHHRYEYCRKMGYPFEVRRISFTGIEAVKNHMILHQLGRRNLSGPAADLLRGKLYNGRKKSKAEAGQKGGQAKAKVALASDGTDEAIAKETGVSPRTVRQDAEFADAVETLKRPLASAPRVATKCRWRSHRPPPRARQTLANTAPP